jgi:hypothetical protein
MKPQSKFLYRFLVNNLLLLSGIATIVSGLLLQLGFHIGSMKRSHERGLHTRTADFEQVRDIDPNNMVWGIDYTRWSMIHKIIIVFFLLLMIYHAIIHWNWYKGVFIKHLIKVNNQVIILSMLFILVALTGLIPWCIDLSGNKNIGSRLFLIEIHDKLAILLTIYLILHVIGRLKWFSNTYHRLKK